MPGCRPFIVTLFVVITTVMSPVVIAADPQTVAEQVDRLLADELFAGEVQLAALSDDQVFLRRVFLDVIGQPPTANQITAFVLDESTDKRRRVVADLLASEKFGENWARYWWDVIIFRASEARAAIFGRSGMKFLTDSFNNQNASWREITKSLITVVGDVPSNGNSLLVFAQEGNSAEIAAEVSRIFLGIQIQCAQCHDHPYDPWKREQFHELAAFFGGVGMTRTLDRPDIYFQEIREGNNGGGASTGGSGRRPKTLFGWAVYSADNPPRRRAKEGASAVKTNSKYYMSDLNDPTSDGKLMAPSLFVTGQRARAGMGDAQRRNLLATWLTDKSNPWFSKAFVNRMWSEMVGEGFYEPIDDIGPDRPCTAPKTLDYLASEFANNEYDVKWLFATITSTKAYQRQARVRRSLDTLPFVANSPQPLRANQIQASLAAALGISTGSPSVPARPSRSGIGAGMRGGGMMGGAGGRGRRQDDTFAYDPSTRRDEITNTITQALFMMNSRTAGGAIDVNGTTSLERLLRAISDNEALASELYLRCFSREPTPSEIKTCLTYLRESRNRKEAFEDIFWALINSAEFRQRR